MGWKSPYISYYNDHKNIEGFGLEGSFKIIYGPALTKSTSDYLVSFI